MTKLGPVFVVLYRNQFASYGDAKQGMAAQLPAEVAEGGWIRQLAALQKVYAPVNSHNESHASLEKFLIVTKQPGLSGLFVSACSVYIVQRDGCGINYFTHDKG